MQRSERKAAGQPILRAALLAGLFVLLAALVLVYRTRLFAPAAVLGAVTLISLSYRWPMPMLAIEMFLSTSAFKFIGVQAWPHLIREVPLDPPDLLILVFFAIGALKLLSRREVPLFLGPLLLYGLAVSLSAVLAPLQGTQTLYESLNGLRQATGYLFYVGVVGVVDSPGRLRWLVRIVFAFVLASVAIQALELLRGEQFTTAIAPFNPYYAGEKMVAAGTLEAPYLWNRAGGYLLVGLLLALGQGLWTGSLLGYGVALAAMLGYVVQLIRQWYVFIALGGLVSLVLLPRNRLRALAGLGLLAVVLGLGILVSGSGSPIPLAKLWLGRIATLANFAQEPNFVFRLQTWQEELRLFRQAPIVGHGPGSASRLGASGGTFVFFDADTGMSNTLLQYGLLGTAAAWVLIGAYFRRAWRLYRSLAPPLQRTDAPAGPTAESWRQYGGYAAGLLALGVVMVAGYLTTQDFISYIELAFTTGLALALVDRFSAFAPRDAEA